MASFPIVFTLVVRETTTAEPPELWWKQAANFSWLRPVTSFGEADVGNEIQPKKTTTTENRQIFPTSKTAHPIKVLNQ